MTKEKQNNRELIFLMVFLVLPTTLLFPLSEYVSEDSTTRTLISGCLGGLGAGLGYLAYTLTKQKTMLIRILAICTMLVVGVVIVRTVSLKFDSMESVDE